MQIQDPRIIERFFQVWRRPVSIAGKLYITSLCKWLLSISIRYLYHIFDPILSLFCNVKLYVREPTLYLNISKSTYYIYFRKINIFGERLFTWQALTLFKNTKSEFFIHGYFNKLKVISVETLMNALKYLSNYWKKMHAG